MIFRAIKSVRRNIHAALSLLVAATLACACSDGHGPDGPVDMILWDIVTYEGHTESEGSIFTFRQIDDSPLITLTTPQRIESLEAGQRLLIAYCPESGKAYTDGPVSVRSASLINQSRLYMEPSADYEPWDRDKVYLYSMWRTGNYINLHARLTYSEEPRILRLVLDPSSLEGDYADIYLVHKLPAVIENHDRVCYASFDIAEVWDKELLKGVRIHVANSNLNKDIFTFEKRK